MVKKGGGGGQTFVKIGAAEIVKAEKRRLRTWVVLGAQCSSSQG